MEGKVRVKKEVKKSFTLTYSVTPMLAVQVKNERIWFSANKAQLGIYITPLFGWGKKNK